jgi:hypothetical protein
LLGPRDNPHIARFVAFRLWWFILQEGWYERGNSSLIPGFSTRTQYGWQQKGSTYAALARFSTASSRDIVRTDTVSHSSRRMILVAMTGGPRSFSGVGNTEMSTDFSGAPSSLGVGWEVNEGGQCLTSNRSRGTI